MPAERRKQKNRTTKNTNYTKNYKDLFLFKQRLFSCFWCVSVLVAMVEELLSIIIAFPHQRSNNNDPTSIEI
jgi:hypothetical protein